MPFYVVEGRATEHAGRRWVDNSRPARVMAEVVPMTLCDGDAEGAPEYVAWVPLEHAHSELDDVRNVRVDVDELRPNRPMYLLMVEPFEMGTPKESAVKPLEEAAEAFGAWQAVEKADCKAERMLASRADVLYECCDVIQAACNLMWRMGATDAQVMAAMCAVTRQNEARGRYGAEYASDSKAI